MIGGISIIGGHIFLITFSIYNSLEHIFPVIKIGIAVQVNDIIGTGALVFDDTFFLIGFIVHDYLISFSNCCIIFLSSSTV